MPPNAQIAHPIFDQTVDAPEVSSRIARRLTLIEEAWNQQSITDLEYGTLRAEILGVR